MNLAQKLRQRLARMIATDASGRRLSINAAGAKVSADRGPLLLETLERRQMMAGDVEMLFTDPAAPVSDTISAFTDTSVGDRGSSVRVAEGEPAVNLVELAKWLDQQGFEMYGAHWCPACTQQKQLFEDGGVYLPFTNVALNNAERSQDPQYANLNIENYPTWILPDNSRLVGVQSIETLMQASGFVNPTDQRPTFKPIGPQRVAITSPLHIPVDGYDAEGGPLTVTVSVDNPELLSATVVTGNRSLRLDMEGYGDMVFELFEQRAPVASGRVATLAESGFYDGLLFHRVVDGFVLQAGDPKGDGTGGSNLGTFDDEFHPELQHNRSGVLSFAKSSDDTNNSQFFITEVPTRFLDFNHSVFGQLVEGEDVREAISGVHVGQNSKPSTPVRITKATIFEDTENSVVMLKALGGTGTTNVTFTITDSDGNQFQEVVPVTITEDVDAQGVPINSQPYLKPIADPIVSASGSPATLQLESVDIEGDAVQYFINGLSSNDATATVDSATGLVTVTPKPGFSGDVLVSVGVAAAVGAGNDSDNQTVTFTFNESAIATPTGIELRASSDSGASSSDNVTNLGTLTFDITGVTPGASVQIIDVADNAVLGVGTASGNTISVTTNNLSASGDGTYQVAARQVVGGVAGAATAPITIVYDTTAPTFDTTSIKKTANANTPYTVDLISSEEGSGVTYALTTFPAGATVVPATGRISWTPTAAQTGSNDFTVTLTDKAGNVTTESFSVTVADEPLAGVKLEITDLDGNPITSLDVGQKFLLKMYGTDERPRGEQGGVYSAYADVIFDGTLVRAVPGTSIAFADDFRTFRSGTINTGLIDELGAVNSGTTPTNQSQSLIATIQMETLAAGSVNFVADPADGNDREILLFFNNESVPADAVNYGSASLAIGQAFTAAADSFSVVKDSGATVLDVLANDEIVSGSGTLTVVSVTQPSSGGTVTLTGGVVRFTPAADFVGEVEFTYRVSGPGGVQQSVPVTVTVSGVPGAPVAADDLFTVDAGSSSNSLDVLGNDSSADEPADTLTVTAVTTPTQGGTLTIASDGKSVNYTPPANYVGTDTFTYTLSNGTSTDTASVTVTIASPDNPPTAMPDSFPAAGDAPILEDAPQASYDVLANDLRDSDNQEFVIVAVGTPSAGGTASIGSNGTTLLYQPKANFNGTETVTYTIRDSGGGMATTTATFNITAVNDPPPIAAGAKTITKGAGATTVLTIADLPPNPDTGETLKFVNLSTPSSGTATIAADGQSILFTPANADFSGEVTFEFEVEDAGGLKSGPETMTVTVAEFTKRAIDVQLNGNTFGLLNGDLSAFSLTGTDALNQTINIPLNHSSVVRTATGIRIPNLLPGSYQLNVPAIPFLHYGETAQTIEINSQADEGDESVEVHLGSLKAEYYRVSDWFSSAPRLAVLAAFSPSGATIYAQSSAAAQTAVTDLQIGLNETGSMITVNAKKPAASDATNQNPVPVVLSANVNDETVVLNRGEVGDMQLMLVSLQNEKGGLNLKPPAASGSGGSGGTSSTSPAPASSPTPAVTPQSDAPVPAGEPLSRTEMAALSNAPAAPSSGLHSRLSAAGEALRSSPVSSPASGNAASIDAAMNDVSDSLKRISGPGDRVAESAPNAMQTFTDAVDQVLTSDSLG